MGSFTRAIIAADCGDSKVDSTKVTPSITVLSPKGGETLIFGVPWTFRWASTGIAVDKTFGLYLESINNLACKIADVGALSGEKNITLQENQICPGNPYFPRLTAGRYKFVIDAASATGIENSGDRSDNYFTITSSTISSPVISGVSGPQTLNVNQQGTWTVNASDSSSAGGVPLSYSVVWGDEGIGKVCPSGTACSTATTQSPQQSATFTHTYTTAGTYIPTFTVTNSSGQSSKTSLSVNIIDNVIPTK